MDGKSHYGDGLYQEAEKVLGIDKRTAEDLKMISERFQITERSVNVTWSHHRQVASIKTIEEDENGKAYFQLLNWAKLPKKKTKVFILSLYVRQSEVLHHTQDK